MSDESRIPAWAVAPARRPRAIVLDRRKGEDPLDGKLMETIASQLDVVEQGAELQQPEMLDEVDLIVVLGGDGSILRAAQQMGTRQRPVIGINLGRLGFLAAISPGEVESALASIVSGDCVITSHLMLKCSLIRDGKVESEQLGLNEAAIRVGNPFSLLDIDLYVDSKLATTYSCDGLIISTPVGSTAHSLSAGGPILRKTMQAFVIAAISPHTLTVRPVVDSAERVFEMRVRTADVVASLVVDGQQLACLSPDDRVRIERASESFQIIEVADRDDYQILREKLDWGGRIRHKK